MPTAASSPESRWLTSPPQTPYARHLAALSIIAAVEAGMITGTENATPTPTTVVATKQRKQRKPRKYVSKHFKHLPSTVIRTPPATPKPRIVAGVNLDDLSSDSDLSDVPDDIGPNPFAKLISEQQPARSKLIKTEPKSVSKPRPKHKHHTKSPYFPNKPRPKFLSCLPFPPLCHETFGLMQERLAHDPFRLLIATIFLNKTPGERAMPVFYHLMERYPTVSDLAAAEVADVTEVIRKLGFQNQRARKMVAMAKMWMERPPEKGKRIRKKDYPEKGDGRDIGAEEVIADETEDERVAWEISHLPGLGPYSHDSWRMFCRDELRGMASDWLGNNAGEEFEPEWKRVVPMDKELRAWATWMWLKEGWAWNKETGERAKADPEVLETARGGGIVKEEEENQHLVIDVGYGGNPAEKPAGDFMLDTYVSMSRRVDKWTGED